MTDDVVDKALQKASEAAPRVEPEVLKQIIGSMQSSLRPVRPLPPTWVMAAGLTLICAAVATAAAAHIGFYGFEKLVLWERLLIFSTLGILVWTYGVEFVSRLIPGSRQHLPAGLHLSMSAAVLLGVFALVYHDHRTDHFLSAGVACLLSGLLLAIPAALLSWLLLRRGYAVNSVAAGLVGGGLAGLCGVTMLELHCANSQVLHVLVWHTGVVPVSAAVGALVGWALRRLEFRR